MKPQGNDGNGRRGVSLIELVVALGIIAVALLALMSVIFSAGGLQQTTREKAAAYNFIRRVLEEMRSTPTFTNIYRTYNSSTADGFVSPINATYIKNHLGLNPPEDGTPQLQIIFPEKSGVLNETAIDTDLGTPKDLDWSGFIEDKDVSTTYKILPVRIIVRWCSAGKRHSQIQISTFITDNR
jgi:prepilin-type N-terminal cleavage/methylation domain-containing protein